MEGRRYKDEPTPINESLERHYKEEIKRLEANIGMLERELNDTRTEIERLNFSIRLQNVEIESLVKSLAGGEMNV